MGDQRTAERPTRDRPAVRDPVMARGTLLTLDMDRLAGFVAEGLGLEAVRTGADRMAIRDRRTGLAGDNYWVLDVTAVDAIAQPQAMLNHWGVTVDSAAEVDEAFAKISAIQEKYGIARVQKPRNQHGSYSFYIADADSNWWEVEYREPGATYADLVARAAAGEES